MTAILIVIHVTVCIALIMIVLLQTGKGADMGAAFGGGSSQTLFGSTGASTFLSKATTVVAVVFMLTSLALAYISTNRTGSSIITDTPYGDLKHSLDVTNMAVLEAAMDNFLILYLRQTRQRAFGVEPLIGYMLGKEMEIKNLRIIYVCKVNGFGEEPIKERLRDTYV